jgi:serine protease AprX
VVSSTLTSRFIAAYPKYPDQKTVQFYDVSYGTGINSWIWNFGDGTVSYEKNPSHVYSESNCYVVTQSISNGYADSSSAKTVCTG